MLESCMEECNFALSVRFCYSAYQMGFKPCKLASSRSIGLLLSSVTWYTALVVVNLMDCVTSQMAFERPSDRTSSRPDGLLKPTDFAFLWTIFYHDVATCICYSSRLRSYINL